MRNRGIVVRLLTLGLVSALCLAYILFSVVGVTLGRQKFHMTVLLDRGGGIFDHSGVTYRGVQVGTVTAMVLGPDHVELHLQVKAGSRIPVDSTASVIPLSAAGEQYLDFVPNQTGPPYLHAGSVVPASQTRLPVSVGQVLGDLGQVVAHLSPTDLRTLSSELATALSGTGTQLSGDLGDLRTVFAALAQTEPQTIDLLHTGVTALGAISSNGAQFDQFSAGLAGLSTQLAASDADLRGLLANGTTASQQTTELLARDAPALTGLITKLTEIGDIAAARVPAVQALLGALPTFGEQLASIVQGNALRIGLGLNTKSPICTYRTPIPLPTQVSNADPPLDAYCAPTAVGVLPRGAANAPRPAGDTTANPSASWVGLYAQ